MPFKNRFKEIIVVAILLCSVFSGMSKNKDSLVSVIDYDTLRLIESHHTPNGFFKDRYLNVNLEQYLDVFQELVMYQNETVGDFARPDQLTFSISGNSYKWNRHYINGFRVNDLFFAGNSLHKTDLTNYNLDLDVWNTSLSLTQIDSLDSEIKVQWNHGEGFGGRSPYTADLIHLFHRTAEETFFVDVDKQRMTKDAVEIFANYSVDHKGKKMYQSAQFNYGQRMWLGFDYKGLNRYYPENFLMLNLSGEFPLISSKLFDSNYYLISHINRDHLYAEQNYDKEETAYLNETNVSFYGKREVKNKLDYTSGITFASKLIEHNNLNFTRNFIDQDAEGVEPWSPDGRVVQMSHALSYNKHISNHLSLVFDGYNSLVNFTPTTAKFNNPLYFQSRDYNYTSLAVYEWSSNAFSTGLYENTLGLHWMNKDFKRLMLLANVDASFDGYSLKNKSRYSPNWEAEFRTQYNPFKFLELTFAAGRKRIPYHFEQIKFLSDDYLSGDVYYWNDTNEDKLYQASEQGDLYTTTGGKSHSVGSGVDQPAYIYIEFPFKFKIGEKHNFIFYNQFRKYTSQWRVNYANTTEQSGYFKDGIYYLNNGAVDYKIEEFESEKLTSINGNDHYLFDSPFFSGSTFKYQFNAKRVFFTISWTYHQLMGLGSYGNGYLHNDLDVLSESQANPNSEINGVALLDSDRSYVGRFLLSYKLSKKIAASFSFKFKDGQTISSYGTKIDSNNGNNQLAVWMLQMKGNNEFNDDHGNREDAFFNSVLTLVYKGDKLNANISMYNIYDFATDLTQYSFSPTDEYNRYSMEVNIPRGLMVTLGYRF